MKVTRYLAVPQERAVRPSRGATYIVYGAIHWGTTRHRLKVEHLAEDSYAKRCPEDDSGSSWFHNSRIPEEEELLQGFTHCKQKIEKTNQQPGWSY